MKILAIGDPHGNLEKINKISKKEIDLILLTGDLGSADLVRKMVFKNIERKEKGLPEIEYSNNQWKKAFMESYSSSLKVIKYLSKYAPIYTIFGNVEKTNPETRKYAKRLGLKLPFLTDDLASINGVRIINNLMINFNGIKIGGLQWFTDVNWIQDFKPLDYRKEMKRAKKQTEKAKKILKRFGNINILVCHQPPYGILDKVTFSQAPKHWKGKHAGSKTILNYIKKYQPKYVFCGHIHEGEGKTKIGKTEVYNLGVCGYKIINLYPSN